MAASAPPPTGRGYQRPPANAMGIRHVTFAVDGINDVIVELAEQIG